MSKATKESSSTTTDSKAKVKHGSEKTIDEIKPGDIIYAKNFKLYSFRMFFELGDRNSKGQVRNSDQWNKQAHPELVLEVNKERETVTTVQISSFAKSTKLTQVKPPIPKDKLKFLIPVHPSVKESSSQPFTVSFKYTGEEKKLEGNRCQWVAVLTTSEIAPWILEGGVKKVRTISDPFWPE